MAAVLWATMTVLAALGALVLLAWMMPAPKGAQGMQVYYLLPMTGSPEDWERRLRWAYTALQWERRARPAGLLLVQMEEEPQLWQISRCFARQRPGVAVCTAREALELLQEGNICKWLEGVLY